MTTIFLLILDKLFIVVFLLLSHQLFGQQLQSSSSNSVLDWSDEQLGKQNIGLINGKKFTPELLPRSHPFFLERDPKIGEIWFDQQHYNSVSMVYNLYRDKVLLTKSKPSGEVVFIEPDQSTIQQFSIDQHKFIHFLKDGEGNNYGLKTGYYEVLWEGKQVSLLVKRWKTKEIENQLYFFKDRAAFYLTFTYKNQLLTGKGDFIKFFPEQKREINDFIKNKALKIKTSNIPDLILLTEFCDSL